MIKIRTLKAHNFKQLKEVRIRFPDRGSVLVEGRNEAGKSTLFEAIFFGLFGDALVTEDNRNDLKDLIEYSASMAVVELGLEVRGRLLRITRTINREKPNAWRLSIFGPDGAEEQVSKNAAVDLRIIQEIGLDGDALLNSCFVEQKKLEKLEGLSASDRRKALMRILNLEAMEELEVQFKRRREDDFRHSELANRLQLARVLEQIPARELEKAELDRKLTLVEMRKALTAIEDRRAQIARARALIEELAPERRRLEEQLEQIRRFKEGQAAADRIIVNLQRIAEWEREIGEIDRQLGALSALEAGLPAKEARAVSLGLLARHLARLERLGEAAAECERELGGLREQFERIAKLRASSEEIAGRIRPALQQIESDRGEEARGASLVRIADQRDALDGWRRAKSTAEGLWRIEAEEARIRAASAEDERRRSGEESRYAAARRQMARSATLGALALALALGGWFGLGSGPIAGLGLIGFAGLIFVTLSGWSRAKGIRGNLGEIDQALRGHQENLLRMEGQRQSLGRSGEIGDGRLGYFEEALRALGIEAPDSPAAGDSLLLEIEARLEGRDAQALRAELAAVRQNLAGREATLKEMEAQGARVQAELRGQDEAALRAREESLIGRKAKLSEIMGRWTERAERRAGSLSVAPELQIARETAALLREELSRNRGELSERGELSRRQAARRESVEELHAANAAEHPAIQVADERAPGWLRENTQDYYQKVSRFYASKAREMDEPGTAQALLSAEKRSHAAQGESDAHERDIEQRTLRLMELCRRGGILPPEGEIERGAMEARLPELRKVPADDAELRLRRDQVAGELVHLGKQRQELVSKLRVEGVELDSGVCERELKDFERGLLVRSRAERIVKQAREQLVSKVLPSTIEHMRRILPVLTMDRYHDAEITENYLINVWDERAGGWRAKNIFSGGTKDQFSLALRLAFALATLPQERGAAPGFIFLDEPLSSFDHERSLALTELITAGEIAESFDQIFVISHSQVLDSTMFNHYLALEDGRIVTSTLEPLEESG